MNIIPGILESSFETISDRVSEVAHFVSKVQIDICDGLFVQSKTWPYSHIKTGRIEDNFHIKQLQSEDIGLPMWDTVEYQYDLMIKDPWRTISTWAKTGATSVVIHPTACDSIEKLEETLRLAQDFMLDTYISYTYDEWIAVKTDADVLKQLIQTVRELAVKGFQAMTIEHIGVQGQQFDNRWAEEIVEVKKIFPELHMQFDGGIGEKKEKYINKEIIDSLIIGSGIFAEGNPGEHVQYYSKLFS